MCAKCANTGKFDMVQHDEVSVARWNISKSRTKIKVG